jgi:CSLREA domain-containing protein
MDRDRVVRRLSVLGTFVPLAALVLVGFPAVLPAATITVNTTADGAANDGSCTLGEAIAAANSNTASGGAVGECDGGDANPTLDTIAFAITSGCAAITNVCTITPGSSLPAITGRVDVNGYSQSGASANTLAVGNDAVLLIELNGTSVGGIGLHLAAGSAGSTLRGLVINRFNDEIQIATGDNLIAGNFIGTDPTGLLDRGSTGSGILITGSGNTIGGTTPAARNLISGNNTGDIFGIFLNGAGAGSTPIQGNYIGTNPPGTPAIPNGFGINAESSDGNTIGGTTAGARNVISGNGNNGVRLSGSDNNVVQGNYIGVGASGTTAIGNGNQGLRIDNATGNTVGGLVAGAGNVISANGDIGVRVTSSSNTTVSGNLIGLDANGNPGFGNLDGGVHVFGAIGTLIRTNSIHGNQGSGDPPSLGIDLDVDQSAPDDGVTPNDVGTPPDTDTGSNTLQNFPVLTSASFAAGTSMRVGALQDCPELDTSRMMLDFTTFSKSTSSSSTFGDLPPSSWCTRFTVAAALRATSVPARVEPVNDTMSISG